jgi:hypothetical protein
MMLSARSLTFPLVSVSLGVRAAKDTSVKDTAHDEAL